MTLTFVRSGGLAAVPAFRISGRVTFDDTGANVTAEPSYRRALAADEHRELAAAAAAATEAGRAARPRAGPVRDGYHFTFTIEDASGRRVEVTANSGSPSLTPPVRTLVEWADREAAAIRRASL